MSEPAKNNTGVIVAVIVGALIVVGGIFWNQHATEERVKKEASEAQFQEWKKDNDLKMSRWNRELGEK